MSKRVWFARNHERDQNAWDVYVRTETGEGLVLRGVWSTTGKRDALLAAAAPDLLEAARRAVTTIRELTDSAPEFEQTDLLAAIAKAEGK